MLAMVRIRGLEPPRSCPHTDLNRTRLPIPPYPQMKWWTGMDSNHRSLWQRIYSPLPLAAREPVHIKIIAGAGDGTRTRNLLITNQLLCQLSYTSVWNFQRWRSGRGSNPRPPAWQAGILTNWTTGPRYEILVGLQGLEPRTNRLWADRSDQLS